MYRFFVNKVRDAPTVEDLVQETFTRLAQVASNYAARSTVRTFIFGVARMVLLEHYRDRGHGSHDVIGVTSVVDLGAGPSSVAAAREELRILLDALRRIAFDKQMILELYYFEDLTGPELAEFMGVPENTARSRIRIAMDGLRETIGRNGPGSPSVQSLLTSIEGWVRDLQHALGGHARAHATS
jgi:RNA polymerase sigma-70 factor (ECF subfamily)